MRGQRVFIRACLEPQLFADQFDIRFGSGQKQPAGTGMILLCIGLQRGRSVALRIDAERVKPDIAPEMVAQNLGHLCHACGLERTGVAAFGVHQVDDDAFAFQQVVVEVNGLAVLGRERHVGEVIGAPRGGGSERNR